MSRIGKMPIKIKEGVSISITGDTIKVSGPKGELEFIKNKKIDAKAVDDNIVVSIKNETSDSSALWGLTRTLINNMVIGVRDRKSTRLNSSHIPLSRMPSSA